MVSSGAGTAVALYRTIKASTGRYDTSGVAEMIFKQFYCEPYAALSYLLADPVTREAAIIDPVAGQEEAILLITRQWGLTLRYLLETHLHDDHPSAIPLLKKTIGAQVAVHEAAGMACCDRQLRDADRIYLGEEYVEVLHTPCSVTYRFQDRLFTGDTLGIGCIGAVGGENADAAALFDSIRNRLYTLPGETLVYPAHDRGGHRVSCIKQEKLWNRDLSGTTGRDEFLQRVSNLVEPARQKFTQYNRRCEAAPLILLEESL